VSVEKTECIGNDYKVTVKSIGFSHAVSFGLPSSIRLSDEYFDMLPGDVRVITFYNAADKVSMDDIHVSRVNPMNGK
jgi:beta-mannosidase